MYEYITLVHFENIGRVSLLVRSTELGNVCGGRASLEWEEREVVKESIGNALRWTCFLGQAKLRATDSLLQCQKTDKNYSVRVLDQFVAQVWKNMNMTSFILLTTEVPYKEYGVFVSWCLFNTRFSPRWVTDRVLLYVPDRPNLMRDDVVKFVTHNDYLWGILVSCFVLYSSNYWVTRNYFTVFSKRRES